MEGNKIIKLIRQKPRLFLIIIIAIFAIIIITIFIIYNNTKEDQIGDERRNINILIDQNLPYVDFVSDLEFIVHRELYPNNPNNSYLQININACGDQNVIEKAKTKVRNWVNNLGINPNIYELVVPELCDGEAS